MRILIVSQYFWPEDFRINDLAKSLAHRGFEIDILTGKPNYPEGIFLPGYAASGIMRESYFSANVIRVPIFSRGIKKKFRLLLNYLSFIFSASIIGTFLLRKTKSDIIFVYATSPLLQALPALFIGWIKRIPVVVYVQDLWPESLEATGYISNKYILYFVDILIKIIYQSSDLILISSRPFKDSIQRYLPSADIIYYPNSVDSYFTDPDSGLKPDIPQLNSKFCLVFAGNLGAAQAVHVIIEAATILKDEKEIHFVIFGTGSELDWMRSQILGRGLENIFLAGRYPVQAMPFLLSKAAALLVTLADRQIFAATVPNKIQAYLAVGRPILAAIDGEGARIIREAGAGLVVNAEDSTEFAKAIKKLYMMPIEERNCFGVNGRQYYKKHFNHEKLVSKLLIYFKNLVKVRK